MQFHQSQLLLCSCEAVAAENPGNDFGYFQVSRGSTDNTAQGWAEITEVLTVAGRYLPYPESSWCFIENTCEDCTDCLSYIPMGSLAIKQKKTQPKTAI